TPALLTRMSMRSKSRSTVSATRRQSAPSRTSQSICAPRQPRSAHSVATSSSRSALISVTTVVTPSDASVRAISRPMPRPPPVTVATLPARSISIGSLPHEDRPTLPLGVRPIDLAPSQPAHQAFGIHGEGVDPLVAEPSRLRRGPAHHGGGYAFAPPIAVDPEPAEPRRQFRFDRPRLARQRTGADRCPIDMGDETERQRAGVRALLQIGLR